MSGAARIGFWSNLRQSISAIFENRRTKAQVKKSPQQEKDMLQRFNSISGESPGRRIMSPEEVANFEAMLTDTSVGKALGAHAITKSDGTMVTSAQGYAMAKRGDYSAYAGLHPIMKGALASAKMHDLARQGAFNSPPGVNLTPQNLSSHIRTGNNSPVESDPSVRLGLDLAGKDGSPDFAGRPAAFFKAADKAMTDKKFRDTLAPISDEQVEALRREGVDDYKDRIARAEYSQRVMAKLLLASQMGKMAITDDAGNPMQWNTDMTELFTSGVRTGFILPQSITDVCDDKRIVESIYGPDLGKDMGNEGRAAASHRLVRKTTDAAKPNEATSFEEEKGLSLRRQYGMDIPGGGLGKKGTNGRIILNDGASGHLYSHIYRGDKEHFGGLLVGVESDAPGTSNFEGHTHLMNANSESTSTFGAQKTSLVGRKYDGRTIDLSHVPGDYFTTQMDKLDKYMQENQKAAREGKTPQEREAARQRLADLTNTLSGEKIPSDRFSQTLPMLDAHPDKVAADALAAQQAGRRAFREVTAEASASPFAGVKAEATSKPTAEAKAEEAAKSGGKQFDFNALVKEEREENNVHNAVEVTQPVALAAEAPAIQAGELQREARSM